MQTRQKSALIQGVLVLGAIVVCTRSDAQEALTPSVIADRLEASFEQLNRCYITTITTQVDPSGREADADGFDEMGFFGDKRYRRRKHWTGAGWFEMRHVFDGERTGSEEITTEPPAPPKVAPATISSYLSERKILGKNALMDSIGSPFYDGPATLIPSSASSDGSAAGRPLSVVKALRTAEYSLNSDTELIQNHECLLLECRHDKIWLCQRLNFAIVKRVWQAPMEGKPIEATVRNFDFTQVSDDLWLPNKYIIRMQPPGNYPGAPETIGRLVSVKLGEDVPTEIFEIAFSAGTAVVDASVLPRDENGAVTAVNYHVGITADATAQNLESAVRVYEGNGSPPRAAYSYLFVVNALILLVLGGIYWRIRNNA